SFAACTSTTHGSDESVPIRYEGTPGTVPAVFAQNVLRVMASVNGSPKRAVVVDTGAAITAFDGTGFADASFKSGKADTVGLDGLTFHDVPAVEVSICGSSCTETSVNGLLGANILRQFVASFDYQGGFFSLGPKDTPDWADPSGISVPFALEGGGTGTIQGSNTVLTVPATRIGFTVTIDGKDRRVILDTGASYVLLRPSLFSDLTSDGRKTLAVSDQTV